jgi:hypothetical protein
LRTACLALLLLAAAPLGARELSWDSIEVTARLDGVGTLHVRERQQFVFSGDWNGGERRFRVGMGRSSPCWACGGSTPRGWSSSTPAI